MKELQKLSFKLTSAMMSKESRIVNVCKDLHCCGAILLCRSGQAREKLVQWSLGREGVANGTEIFGHFGWNGKRGIRLRFSKNFENYCKLSYDVVFLASVYQTWPKPKTENAQKKKVKTLQC